MEITKHSKDAVLFDLDSTGLWCSLRVTLKVPPTHRPNLYPRIHRKWFWYSLDCMQGKVLSGKFRQYGRRVSMVRVSVKTRVRFRFICVGDPTCSHGPQPCSLKSTKITDAHSLATQMPGRGILRIAECGKLSRDNLRKIRCGFFSAEWRVKCRMKYASVRINHAPATPAVYCIHGRIIHQGRGRQTVPLPQQTRIGRRTTQTSNAV